MKKGFDKGKMNEKEWNKIGYLISERTKNKLNEIS